MIPYSPKATIDCLIKRNAIHLLMKQTGPITPRLIRLRDAPAYLGMDRNRFNAEVRPCLTEIPIGKQGIAFDRLELDA